MTRYLCTICARGGSKGVPGKNIRNIAGKPLIAHTIDVAKETGLFDVIAVSSDSQEILDIAKEYGATLLVLRPAELAQDSSGKLPVIQHAAQEAIKQEGAFDILVDLDVTSPLRNKQDILNAIELLKATDATNVITGSEARRSPYFNLVEDHEAPFVKLSKSLENSIVRRQASPNCYDMNASIYVWPIKEFANEPYMFTKRTALYEMPVSRSWDIDEPLDFEIVEFLLSR